MIFRRCSEPSCQLTEARATQACTSLWFRRSSLQMDSTYTFLNGGFKPTLKRFTDLDGPDFNPTPAWATYATAQSPFFNRISPFQNSTRPMSSPLAASLQSSRSAFTGGQSVHWLPRGGGAPGLQPEVLTRSTLEAHGTIPQSPASKSRSYDSAHRELDAPICIREHSSAWPTRWAGVSSQVPQ